MKRFNLNEFIWFIVLFSFTLYTYYLLSTGKILLFVHPEMVKYSALSFIFLGELTVFQLFKIFTIKTRVSYRKGYLLFLITLIMGVFIAPKGLNSDIWEKKGVTLVSSGSIENIGKHSHEEKEKIHGDVITFNAYNYLHYLEEISENMERHKGKRVVINGFILKDNSYEKNEFLLTRVLMNCCAADSQAIGILCRSNKSHELKNGDWVRIEGTISSKTEKGMVKPIILVDKIQKTEKPENDYIYE
jgi:putative membrane protein